MVRISTPPRRGTFLLLSLLAFLCPALSLAQGPILSGQVVDESGDPLNEVQLTVRPEPSLEERIEGFLAEAEGAAPATLEDSAVETRSDGSGAFRLPLPRPGFFRLTLRKEGRLSLEVWLHPITGDREMPPLVLPKPRTMAVTVLDPAGAPAVGAWVRVPPHPAVPYGPRLAFPVWAPERLVRADGKGQVRLPRSPGTTAEVQAWAPGFVEATGRTGASVTLRLAVAETVRLELVGEQREALGNTLVLVGESLFPAGRSDAEGRFEVSAKARRPLLLHLIPGDGLPRIERLPAARGDEPLRLTLASPVWLDGRVTNAASGQPLAGALVWTPGRDTRWTSTDRGGAFRLALLAEQTRLRASAEGFFGADLQPKPMNGLFPAASIALHSSAELSGLVQDPEGRPVAGAQVTSAFKSKAGPRLGPDLWREARTERLARSDARGRFLLRELLPETPYLLTTRHPRWAEEQTPVTLPATGDPGVPLRIVLRAGITARGRVEDAEERPVPGAQVRLWPAGDDPRLNLFREPTHRTFTDAEGHFSFHALAEGLYELELVASGHASRRLPGMKVAAPEADWGALQLAAGLRLEGQVQEASGAGIGEVAIWVQTGPEARNLFPYQRLEEAPDATSDPRGGFQVEDLAAGTTMSLRLTREGFAPKTVPGLTLPLDQPLVITLEPASAVRGQVLDGSGNPLPEATIGIEHEPGPQGRGRVLEIQQTAPDGAFEFRGLAAGRFALRALKEGYQTATVAVEVPAGQDVEGVEVLLRDGWAIRGRVLDGDRLPVAGAQVAGQPLGRGGSSRMVTSSDGGGRFILEGLPAGTIELVAAHRDHPELRQRIELEGADREIELVFPRGVSVSGVVESAEGGVVGGAEVMLVKAGSWRSDLSTTSRSDGSFTIEEVPPGQWILAATAEGYSRSSLSNPLEIRSQPVSGLRLEISRGTRVVGRITGLDPNRWPGLQVRAILRTGASPQLRQGKLLTGEGYRIDGLSAGTWMIQAEVEGSALLETLVVEEGVEEVRRDFEFVEGLTLSGVVTDAAQPQSGLNVSVWSIDTGKAGGGVTDESGRFTVQGLVEGTYTVQIHSSSGVPRYRSEIELPASREIEIRLDEGSSVAGQVVDGQDGQPMASVVVTLARARGDRHGMTETRHSSSDSTGRFSFDRVEVGDWILHVKAHGYEPLEQPITVHEGEALPELRLELSPRNTLRLKLRAREGVLPDRVSVSAFTAGGQAVGTTFRPPVSEEGWVDLDSLPRVPCTVLVASADHALTEAQLTPGVETELLLPRGASLAVRVPELQEDRTGATLRLFSPSLGRALRWPNYPSGVRDSLPFILGAGQLAAIPPGAWTVLVRAADGREWSAEVQLTAGSNADLVLE